MEITTELLHRAYGAYRLQWLSARGSTLADINEEQGLPGGECFVCFSEFQQNEFQDPEIMRTLLTSEEYNTYLKLVHPDETKTTTFFTQSEESLYAFLQKADRDYDTADSEYDCIVTVCADTYDKGDPYDNFCKKMLESVKIVDFTPDKRPIVDWSQFIQRNLDKFRAFAKEHWYNGHDEDEELIYEWVLEIGKYLAGYLTDPLYTEVYNLLCKCK